MITVNEKSQGYDDRKMVKGGRRRSRLSIPLGRSGPWPVIREGKGKGQEAGRMRHNPGWKSPWRVYTYTKRYFKGISRPSSPAPLVVDVGPDTSLPPHTYSQPMFSVHLCDLVAYRSFLQRDTLGSRQLVLGTKPR